MERVEKEWPSVSGKKRVLRIPGVKNHLNIGSWNVQSLYEAGKLTNTVREMQRLNLTMLGVCETRWPDSGQCDIDGATFYYSGNQDKHHRHGVGIIMDKSISKSVTCFIPYSDRAMLLKIEARPININIIQVYAPTLDKPEEEIESFYEDIKRLLKYTKPHDLNIIQGDFNAKVGRGEIVEGIAGPWGLGERNIRGDRLIQFCQEEQFKITNTWFSLPPRRLYTWRAPRDSPENIVRNQIDFILVNKRFSTSVTKAQTYPGADVPSDHCLLAISLKLKIALERINRNQPKKLDTSRLQEKNVRSDLRSELNKELERIKNNKMEQQPLELWETVENSIKRVATERLGYQKRRSKRKWMTDEILQMMDERRQHKNINHGEYKRLNSLIRSEIRKAKRRWLEEECESIEYLQQTHNTREEHRKIKEASGVYKKRPPTILTDDTDKFIIEEEDKKRLWEEYITDLFADDSREELTDNQLNTPLSGPPILKEEIRKALMEAKDQKATGPDGIPAEVLKLIDEENIAVLHKVFNHIYDTGHFPRSWLKSNFIPLPKKNNARKCKDHRLISLMNHCLKIFLKIIHRRIKHKCERNISPNQFGFKSGMGTREALFGLQVLIQNCRDVNKDIFLCFVDYEKAFDRVQHSKLMQILRQTDIDGRDIRCIENLYWWQSASITTQDITTEDIEIRRGVRQGCVLSPLLFNLYSEAIFTETFEDQEMGVKVNGMPISNIRYADDTVLIANDVEELQQMCTSLNNSSNKYGININDKKTKFMIISRKNQLYANAAIHINNQNIERVTQYKYLGSWLHTDWNSEKDIRYRIEMARTAFMKYEKILRNQDIHISLRVRYAKCYVWSVLLYGVESWTMKANMINKVEAFEMWTYRRLLRVPWTDRVTNEEILRRVHKNRELFKSIKQRKTAYLGHIFRHDRYQLLQLILEGKIEGRRGIGRKQMSWTRNIRQWTGLRTIEELVSVARDRNQFQHVVANIH